MSSKPWYHNGLRFSCTGSGNCCRTHGEYAYVYLTDQDAPAIADHLGLEPAEFEARHCTRDDGHLILRIDSPACPFLTEEARCSIYPVRPQQCAAWPFWTDNLKEERWFGEVSGCCPGIGQGELHSAEEVERIALELEEWYEED